MPEYSAPVRDLKFVLDHIVDLPQLAREPAFSEATDDLVDSVLDEAARLANEEFAPLNETGDRDGVRLTETGVTSANGFVAAYANYRDAGWLSLAVPTEHGGQGLPFALHMAVSEMWNSANVSLALCPMLSMGAIEALIHHGSDALRAEFLPPLVAGEWTGTMNLTEPQAGSDLSAVKTLAVPDGDSYLISGQKIYITWGEHDLTDNVLHLVLARTPDAPPGSQGLSLFLVPKFLPRENNARNAVWALSVEHKLGIHASPTCVMSFGDDDRGARGYLVGELGRGLACMFTMMNHARLEVGLEGVGLSDRALQAARYYANERRQGQAPGSSDQVAIIQHPDVRRMLLTMRALTEAGRALALVAAATLDRAHVTSDATTAERHERRLHLLTPLVKAWCTEMAQEVTSLGVQVHGGMGYVEETGVAQYLRDARITPIYEGTNGIQAADFIGRKFLRDDGAAFAELLEEIDATLAELASADGFALGATALASALEAARAAAAVVRDHKTDEASIAAWAFDFMLAAGYLVGGWLLARQGLAAGKALAADTSEIAFYEAKRLSSQFYLSHLLPRVLTHTNAIAAGSAAAAKADPALL